MSQELALNILTGVLAATTAAYAVFTLLMVFEMRAARAESRESRVAALKPRLMISMEHPTATTGRFLIVSCGAAAAFNVEVRIDFGPGIDSVPWSMPIMTTGTQHSFMPPPSDDGRREIDMAKLAARYRKVRIMGTMQDVERTPYDIDELFELRHYWESNTAAGWHHEARHFTRLMRAVEKIAGIDSPVEP